MHRNVTAGVDPIVLSIGVASPQGDDGQVLWNEWLRGTRAFRKVNRYALEQVCGGVGAEHPLTAVQENPAGYLAVNALHRSLAEPDVSKFIQKSSARLYFSSSHADCALTSLAGDIAGQRLRSAGGPKLTGAQLSALTNDRVVTFLKQSGFVNSMITHYSSSACSSFLFSFVQACDDIRAGHVEVAVVVGSDSFSRAAHVGFAQIGALSSSYPQPFSVARDGTRIAEGAISIILCSSTLQYPEPALARVRGCGLSTDPAHMVQPSADGSGPLLAMKDALARGKSSCEEIDLIILHGTGTRQNDAAEVEACRALFGAGKPYAFSYKGSMGHPMGVAGGFGLFGAIMCFKTGLVPPTLASFPLIPDLPLSLPVASPEALNASYAMVNASGFGGSNASVVLKHPRV